MKLEYDEPLLNFAFNIRLRRYTMGPGGMLDPRGAGPPAPHANATSSAAPSVPKMSMFSRAQDGLPQVALALLDRLDRDMAVVGRGLHSSTSQLNLSRV